MSINDSEIRRTFTEQRKKLKISQEDLAATLKTGRSTIAKIEGGGLPLKTVWINKIADALQMHAGIILQDRNEEINIMMVWATERLIAIHTERLKAGRPFPTNDFAVQFTRAVRWCYRNNVVDRGAVEAKVAEYLEA